MPHNVVEKIKSLLTVIGSNKDTYLCLKYLDKRDWNSLKMIIDSDWKKVSDKLDKALEAEQGAEEYSEETQKLSVLVENIYKVKELVDPIAIDFSEEDDF